MTMDERIEAAARDEIMCRFCEGRGEEFVATRNQEGDLVVTARECPVCRGYRTVPRRGR